MKTRVKIVGISNGVLRVETRHSDEVFIDNQFLAKELKFGDEYDANDHELLDGSLDGDAESMDAARRYYSL